MIRYECSICGIISHAIIPDSNDFTAWVPTAFGWEIYHQDSNGWKFTCGEHPMGVIETAIEQGWKKNADH